MSASGSAQIESLNGGNYESWKIQMEALLVRNNEWDYVSGECTKPELVEGDAESEERSKAWLKTDNKAKAEIILSVNPSELTEIKGCDTSREVWLKLEKLHRSEDTPRKVTLPEQLILQRMEDGDDAREHVQKFFYAIEKLSEMDVDIDPELLAIMLLYSLPSSFESLRCAVESRDELPLPEELRAIIIEESDARRNETLGETRNAAIPKKYCNPNENKSDNVPSDKKDEFKYGLRKQYRIKYLPHNREYSTIGEDIGQTISETEAQVWFTAMASEVKSILENDSWLLVDRPENQQNVVYESFMLLRNKHKPDGSLDRREAHVLVGRCFWYFQSTLCSISYASPVRISMAIAAHYGMKIKHFDLSRTYLNKTIDEEVLMETPKYLTEALEIIIRTETRDSDLRTKATKMLEELKSGDKVCLLKKTLDGTLPDRTNRCKRLDESLKRFGAKPSKAIQDLYISDQGEDMLLIIACFDQIIVASRNQSKITKLKDWLSLEYETDDLGDIEYFHGMEFARSGRTVTINQRGFIRDLLDRFGMAESTPVTTPMDFDDQITPFNDDGNKRSYDELIAVLGFLSSWTRPDICYAVNASRETCNWTAAERILRYLKGTENFGLTFGPATESLIGYVGTSNPGDQRGDFNYMFTFGNRPIFWLLDMYFASESEFFENVIEEAIRLRSVLMELNVGSHLGQVKLLYNDVGALERPLSFRYPSLFDVGSAEYRSIRHALDENQLNIEQVSIDDMAVDILMKALREVKHKRRVELIGLGGIDIDQK